MRLCRACGATPFRLPIPILNFGGVGGLSAKLVWCVESFFEGLAKYAFEASGSGSDI